MDSKKRQRIHSRAEVYRPLHKILSILLVAGLMLGAQASPVLIQEKDNRSARLETSIKALLNDWKIPGISICFINDGKVVWCRGLGVKNIQTGDPVNDQTIFQAASLSKPVFAYSVLRMCDEGLLDLDTPLVRYAPAAVIENVFLGHPMDTPGFKKEWFEKITARMCLSHSSGLQHFGLKQPVEFLFEPGTQFYYSSNGIEYLRHIVEHLKEKRIDTLISEYVFEPLDMKDSSFIWRDAYESNSAPGHDHYGKTTGSMDRYDSPTAQATLYTNAQDYGRFLSAVLNGTGLKKETFLDMIKPQIQTNPNVYWGLGFGIETAHGGKGLWHWGDGGTHTSYFYGNLENKSGFVYFVNSYYGLAILKEVFALLSEGEHPALSVTIGGWSFSDDYLSPGMKFRNKYFNGQRDEALAFYRRVAEKHEKGMRFVEESSIQYWAMDFLQRENIGDAVGILQLLIEAYYPERLDACGLLAREYQKTRSNAAAAEYLKTVKNIIKAIHFHWTYTQFSWIIDQSIADLSPVILEDRLLLSYAGKFPPYEIKFENGHLFFCSGKTSPWEMIPLNKDTFRFKEAEYLRIQMVEESGKVTSMKRIWITGQTKVFPKGE